MRAVITYLDMATLVERGSGIVRFGTAPDGLPFLANVPAPPDAAALLREAAWALGAEERKPRYEGTPLAALVNDLDRVLREQLVQQLTNAAGESVEVMILPFAVRTLVGATLLERFVSPSIQPGTAFPENLARHTAVAVVADAAAPLSGNWLAPAYDENTGPVPGTMRTFSAGPATTAPVPQPRFQLGESCLALPRAGGQPVIVYRVRSANGWPEYTFRRTYGEEAISFVKDSWYEGGSEHYSSTQTTRVRPDELARYRQLRAAAPGADWSWQVPRTAFAAVLRDLASQLAGLHERDEIHGDLKPANVLLTANAPEPLDSLRLAAGVRSPAMTRGWASPEQILGLAVAPQTDQYPLGLLLLGLVGGVLYGEEARVAIPVGGTRLEYHTVLRNPGVYLDPASVPVEHEQIEAWRDLIERCVRFDPADRFPTMADLAVALHPLIEANSLTGTLATPLNFGQLVLGSDGVGDPEPCWLVG